jgi:hypothetical protein
MRSELAFHDEQEMEQEAASDLLRIFCSNIISILVICGGPYV